MIVFKVAFLLEFPLVRAEKKTIGKKTSKSKVIIKADVKEPKLTKGKKKALKISCSKDKKELGLPPYVLDAGNPIGFAHIEYRLTPEVNGLVQVYIICWKGIAKVFAGNQVLMYRVRTTESTVWVPVCMHVLRDQMTIDELEDFHDCEIYVNIYTGKLQNESRVKLEKSTQFFMKQEDISSEELVVPVYEEDPNTGEEYNALTSQDESVERDCIFSTTSLTEWIVKLKMPDLIQSTKMKNIIDSVLKNESVFCKEYIPVAISHAMKEERVNNVSKNSIKNNISVESKVLRSKDNVHEHIADGLQIKVSGEVFFTDPTISIFDCKNTNAAILKVFLFLGVENLMTSKQKCWMNPMIVKVKKLNNLDSELLKQKKFKSVFIRYSIPGIAEATTLEREILETIRFDESHAYFTHKVPKLTVTEFIQSNRLFLEICGVREAEVKADIHPSIFGTKHKDKHLAKRMTPIQYILDMQDEIQDEYESIEVIAVTAFDLSSLLIPVWNYTCKESCHCPNNLLYQNRTPPQVDLDLISTNNVNLKKDMFRKRTNALTELSLMEKGTSLQVEVYFMAPVTELSKAIYFRHNCYTRLLLIIYSANVATSLLSEVLQYNQGNFTKEIIIPDLNKADSEYVNFAMNDEGYLSGFVIDDGGTFVFFLEGIYQHKLVWLWKKYHKYPPEEMTIYFNSDFVYEERLYKAFLTLRGLCIITLQKPLRDILAQNAFYLEGNVPIPAWQAAKKLDILFRATTLKDMFQYNLLPTPDELLSLSMEWGVPIKWRDNNLYVQVSKSSKQE
ncbi:hypothetical protein Trydic_g1388 [Trypoxylus dichotomus]